MSINYFPNDPLNGAMRVQSPRPDRPAGVADFNTFGVVAEGTFALGTPEFLFWQCREAALASVEMWEDLTGAALASWQAGQFLDLQQNAGVMLNAFYNRQSLSFYRHPGGAAALFFGASADVVAHEVGHALLDALRPNLWQSALFEVNAFHEAFGDCVALLTALYDQPTRVAVLPQLAGPNFVEAVIESLAEGVRRVDAGHNASVPRRCRNAFQWQIPSTLPQINGAGDGPGVLVDEEHSFGQVFTGCFHDTIVNIFNATGPANEAGLLAAAKTAGRLLVKGTANAPQKSRFFREVGRAMVLADTQDNAGANRAAIEAAFTGHGVALGAEAVLSPSSALDGPAPELGAKPALASSAKRDLLSRLGAVGAKLAVSAVALGKEIVAKVVHERLVPLDKLHKKLKGVVCSVPESVLVGESGGRAAVLGALPDPASSVDEAMVFVKSLLRRGAILFDELPSAKKALAVAGLDEATPEKAVTHAIKAIKGQPTLVRLRYACR